MTRVAYVNGRYRPHAEAVVHVEDRGYQLADGVYEVVAVHRGRFVDEQPHLDRLDRSLHELRIDWPMAPAALRVTMRELVRRNRVREGALYIQVTRGVAPRDHAFPRRPVSPALVMTTRRARPVPAVAVSEGVGVIIVPDIRWQRCDIKSIGLLANVLGKQAAVEAGVYEAWLVNAAGVVTEGTSTNAWIVTGEGRVVTHPTGPRILSGVTRLAVLRLARESQIAVEERPFTLAELRAAREAFLTSTSSHVLPVTRVDGAPVGDGRPGPVSRRLRELYSAELDRP